MKVLGNAVAFVMVFGGTVAMLFDPLYMDKSHGQEVAYFFDLSVICVLFLCAFGILWRIYRLTRRRNEQSIAPRDLK